MAGPSLHKTFKFRKMCFKTMLKIRSLEKWKKCGKLKLSRWNKSNLMSVVYGFFPFHKNR